jgi:hypothetical protein
VDLNRKVKRVTAGAEIRVAGADSFEDEGERACADRVLALVH